VILCAATPLVILVITKLLRSLGYARQTTSCSRAPVKFLRGYAASKSVRLPQEAPDLTAAFQLAFLITKESSTLSGTLGA